MSKWYIVGYTGTAALIGTELHTSRISLNIDSDIMVRDVETGALLHLCSI
jgi:hypothetical protein